MVTKGIQGDLDTVWSIIDRCRASLRECGIFQWDMVYPTRETVAQDINIGRLYVLASLGQVRAVVTIDTQHEDEYNTVQWTTSEPALIVHRLCVDPEVQGQGIGRRLMEFVEQYAVRRRFSSVRLDAYPGILGRLRCIVSVTIVKRDKSFSRDERCHFIASNWTSHQLKVLTLMSMREYFIKRSEHG